LLIIIYFLKKIGEWGGFFINSSGTNDHLQTFLLLS